MTKPRALVGAAFAVLALLRLATLAPDPWEWDEVLFMEGVRDGLDVRMNHPHAPGYPVFIRLGQGIHALGVEPFRATALAGAIGGYLSVLALYLLLRELGSRRRWALVGALLYALTPSVWLHGVRPLSDGLGAAAALFAGIFLVRAIAGRDGPSLVVAAVFTALAAGVRPQVGLALVPAAAVAATVVYRQSRSVRPLVLSFLAGVLLSAAIWLPVFRSSGGFGTWRHRFEDQMKYVTEFDSPRAGDLAKPAFWKRWWIDPVGHDGLAAAFLALAVAGAVLGGRQAGLVLLVFVPVTALTLGVLSTTPATRYVLAFWAAPCALAAFALERASRRRAGRIAASAAAIVLLAAFAALGAPAVVEVASRQSPSVAAMRAVLAAGVPARDVFVTEPLRVHAREFFGSETHVVSETVPVAIPRGGVLVASDRRPFGEVPQSVFTFDAPLLARISRARYLRTEIFEGRSGAGVFVPVVTPPGWRTTDGVELWKGAALSVYGATPADVVFTGTAAGGPAEVEIASSGGARRVELVADRAETRAFAADPEPTEKLFVVSCLRGHVILDAFRVLARGTAPVYRSDDGIPASIDEPVEGARVTPPFRVRGWCQERGGGRVDPVSFRIDGLLMLGVPVTRTPRPDVATVLPEIGDASAAGWEALLSPNAPPGRHVLTVTFQAGDRRRDYPPRTIEIVAPGGAGR